MIPKLGAHVSAAGGVYKIFENAAKIGAECVQIFGGSPKTWRAKGPSDKDLAKYFEMQKKSNLGNVYLHASYLVNLASDKAYNREQSVLSLIDHLSIAEKLKAYGLIFHLGSAMTGTKEDALKFTVGNIKEILKTVPGKAWLIMENSSGGGNKLGFEFSEIGAIMKQVKSPRLKVCLDTAHMFEAGRIDEYSKAKVKRLFDEFEREVGLENLVALHINDSKTPFNSHTDRHENLGEGHIGLEGFKNLAADKRLHGKDWLLEVPGFDGLGPDVKNLQILRDSFTK